MFQRRNQPFKKKKKKKGVGQVIDGVRRHRSLREMSRGRGGGEEEEEEEEEEEVEERAAPLA